MRIFALLVLVATFLSLATASVSYEGYKSYKIVPKTQDQLEMIQMFRKDKNFDFFSQPRKVGLPVTIMVTPSKQSKFERILRRNRIPFHIEMSNVETFIQAERQRQLTKSRLAGGVAFDRYLRFDEINEYLDELATNYPDLVKVETVGRSYENRSLNLIRLSRGDDAESKPTIFVDAGIHAREWIAPAVALYVINQLVENPDYASLSEQVNWVIWPSVNPDGYEYCHETDRMWRKTRSVGKECDGVDANRNFDFHWMDTGASDYECDETYAGPTPLSELEAQTLSNQLLQTENIILYLTLHSYGQYLLYPWGFDSSLPDNWQELDDLGQSVNEAISAVAGTEYTVGSSTNVLYAASGASDDYAMGVGGVPLVYTIELPGGGSQGFDLPESRILDVVVETFEGFKVYHDYVVSQYANKKRS